MSHGLQGKIWGKTQELLNTPLIEVHLIEVNPFCHCSMHKHEFKWNMFYVIEGKLEISIEKNDYELTDKTWLKKNQWCSVKPNEYHQFRTGDKPAKALEIYYLEPLTKDISRKDSGGIDEVDNSRR